MSSKQIFVISVDDSGIFHTSNDFFVYAGLVFLSERSSNHFEKKYKSITDSIRKKRIYMKHKELKASNLKQVDRNRLVKLINKENDTFGIIVHNNRISNKHFLNQITRSKYKNYIFKIIIKNLLNELINDKKLDPYEPLKLIVYRDFDFDLDIKKSEYDKTNSLEQILKDDFCYGILSDSINKKKNNSKKSKQYKPILFNDFEIIINMVDSKTNFLIQGADFIANSIWRYANEKNFVQNKRDVNLILTVP